MSLILLLSNESYKIEMNCRLIIGLLCKIDMLNEEIVYNRFESIFVVVIIGSLLMRRGVILLTSL